MTSWISSFFHEDHDVIQIPISKLVQEQIDLRNSLTPNERLYTIFSSDEYGNLSPEMTSAIETGFSAFAIGGVFGAFSRSSEAYQNWMENNRATAFTDHYAAKRSLQDHVTKAMGKGVWMWGWRTAAFTATYQLVSSSTAVYRGKFGILEHTLGGCGAGLVFKMNMGLRGMAVGGLVGAALGTFAGAISTAICKFSGIEMDHLRYYQLHLKKAREQKQNHELLKTWAEDKENESYPLYERDKKIGSDLSLNNLETPETPKVQVAPGKNEK